MSYALAYSILRLTAFLTSFIAVLLASYTALASIGARSYASQVSGSLERLAAAVPRAAGFDPRTAIEPILLWSLAGWLAVFALGALLFLWSPWFARLLVPPEEKAAA